MADIAKFFDRVRRTLLYNMAEAAGMPPKVLRAYKAYLEELAAYNVLAGGIGIPHKRKCGIPQGCPLSMVMVALIMRPWIILMRKVQGIACYILADDVLVWAEGELMVGQLTKALNTTHEEYLEGVGAKVAPSKS